MCYSELVVVAEKPVTMGEGGVAATTQQVTKGGGGVAATTQHAHSLNVVSMLS